ncbi:helix-turn-helix transcriptional regulator [Bengtsoniella intestinalis]|uniref:helix-turn-helix domain-containing protein n=1 Tax=Bengtsoniella intestinalis TaxID=3073143 RepID=UPI00391F5381
MARNELGVALKGFRIEQGMTQEMVEGRSGISVRTIRDAERGSKDTKMSTLQTLGNVYGMELGFYPKTFQMERGELQWVA